MSPPAIRRPEGVAPRDGAPLREVAKTDGGPGEMARELDRARAELVASTEAREQLAVDAHELAAQAALTRERLSARVAELGADSDALRAEGIRLRETAGVQSSELARLRSELEATTAERDQARRQLQAERETAHDQRRKLETELQDAYLGREKAVRELVPEREALRAAQAARDRLEDELARRVAESAELLRRMELRGEELDAAVRRLTAVEGSAGSLERAIAVLHAEAQELRADRGRLAARVDALTLHGEGLLRTISEREQAIEEHRQRLTERDRAAVRLRAEGAELKRRLEEREHRSELLRAELQAGAARREMLELERERTIEELRRVGASRAWRWGHGTTRMLRRLTFRPSRGRGGVEKLLERLDPPALLPAPDQKPATSEQP